VRGEQPAREGGGAKSGGRQHRPVDRPAVLEGARELEGAAEVSGRVGAQEWPGCGDLPAEGGHLFAAGGVKRRRGRPRRACRPRAGMARRTAPAQPHSRRVSSASAGAKRSAFILTESAAEKRSAPAA